MSDALEYLVKARPEAMGHYFAFLKDCGKHLDPKTRALISVITKVHAQTERGFRQYLKRALRDGCTPAEVLDALLMAFPALGLTRLVWAVDILLAMDLPGFEPAALAQAAAPQNELPTRSPTEPSTEPSAEPRWHDVMPTRGFTAGDVRRVECDGRGLFVYRAPGAPKADEWRVFDSLCPHQTTNIPQLALQGLTLTCPKHEWGFDVTSGACIKKGDSPLKRWPAKVVKGRLLVQW